MEKKKLTFLVVLIVINLGLLLIVKKYIEKDFITRSNGEITIVLINLAGEEVKKKTINFKKNDRLVTLLTNNFDNVIIQNGMLLAIEDFNTPIDYSTFISIYVDDKLSDVGLKDIKFKDKSKISFIMTKNNYIYD